MDFSCADGRYHLISALHQLVDGDTRCALSDFALILVVFISLREAPGRKRMVLFAQKHRKKESMVLGTSRSPLHLARAVVGLLPGQWGAPVGAWPLSGMRCSWDGFLRISVSCGASPAKTKCSMVSAKNIHHGNKAVMGSPAASVHARMEVGGMESRIVLIAAKPALHTGGVTHVLTAVLPSLKLGGHGLAFRDELLVSDGLPQVCLGKSSQCRP